MGVNCSDDKLIRLAGLLGCSLEIWRLKYLGLPLGGDLNFISSWSPVVERIGNRLDGWKKALISKGGWLILI